MDAESTTSLVSGRSESSIVDMSTLPIVPMQIVSDSPRAHQARLAPTQWTALQTVVVATLTLLVVMLSLALGITRSITASVNRSHNGSKPPPRQQKIDHFVVLFMENRAFDHLIGCMDLPGIDGIPPEGLIIPRDPTNLTRGFANVSCGTAPYVCTGSPGYSQFRAKFAPEANASAHPYGAQGNEYSYKNGASGSALRMFSAAQQPVKYALARAFGVFNKLYSAVPGWSSPNHLFAQSATSCGIHDNVLYSECGGSTPTFPMMTVYDSLFLHHVPFAFYMNSTCGLDGARPCGGLDVRNRDAPSAVNSPDVGMDGVGRYKERFFSQTQFYADAAHGKLPSFSWVSPPLQASDHPCHDVAKGERFIKDVYEALRAGPGWMKTLLLVVYDDGGGFYDHVVPPFEGVPADDAPCHMQESCGPSFVPFDFKRLGLRTSAWLVSPWVAEGAVFQEPRGPYPTSQFELSSIPATVKNLFNLSTFLTKRDRWAGSFDELLLDAPRTDTPLHLPEAPQPARPWLPVPVDGGQRVFGFTYEDDDDDGDGNGGGAVHDNSHSSSASSRMRTDRRTDEYAGSEPQHCSAWQGCGDAPCAGLGTPSLKQRRNIRLFAALTQAPAPDVEAMTWSSADAWLTDRWIEWYQAPRSI